MNQMQSEIGTSRAPVPSVRRRRHIVLRSSGHHQGPVTRLVCPSDVGEIIKPFISLDRFDFNSRELTPFPLLPYSGIATLTILLSGDLGYEDTDDRLGHLEEGGVAWMRAGSGVWHGATPASDRQLLGYRLWIALPPELEHAAPTSLYLRSSEVPISGPARVILGTHHGVASKVLAPAELTTLHVQLRSGDTWCFSPECGQRTAWAYSRGGVVEANGEYFQNELAVFSDGDDSITFSARQDVELIVASAVKHSHDLVLGYHSVHTNVRSMQMGEREILRLRSNLRIQGRLR